MNYDIAFYCNSIPFTDATCRLEHSLGGSETMLIGMARELAKLGNRVQIFTKFESIEHEGEYDGVWFYDHSHFRDLLSTISWDIFISLRMPGIMTSPVRAGARFLWNQDELVHPKNFMGHLWQTDGLFFVSDWHKEHYCEKLPELRPFSWVTRNGVDLELIRQSTQGIEKDPYKLIYISRPERGLEPLLQISPKIQRHCPELKLYCARYYSMYEPMPGIKAICDRADAAMAETPGCEYLGNLSKEELYREIASSRLMVYPGVPNFNETGCIAAMEAQACGTPIICTNTGALMETVADGAGVKITGDSYSDEYQAIFTQNVLNLLVEDEKYAEMQEAGYQHMQKYDYSVIAKEWQEYFGVFFESRMKKRGRAIYRQLRHHDDVLAAHHLASELNLVSELKECDEVLSYTEEKKESEKEVYAKHAASPEKEVNTVRFQEVLKSLGQEIGLNGQEELRVLDFASGNGSLAAMLASALPNSVVVGMDFSPQLVAVATEFARTQKIKNISFQEGSLEHIQGVFDIIVCGEFLEHCDDYRAVIEKLESHLTQNGWICFTLPYGPMVELFLHQKDKAKHRGHVVHWEFADLNTVFDQKKNFQFRALPLGITARGNPLGHWIITYQNSPDNPTGSIDFDKKIRVTRPYEGLSICMIGRNDAKWVDLCLVNLVDIADEIIVATNDESEDLHLDSPDDMLERLEKWRDYFHGDEENAFKIIHLPELCPGVPLETPPPGNFSWLRNESIKLAIENWIGWVDFDEGLTYPIAIRKYLTDSVFNGFGVRQVHLSVDKEKHHDVPIRIFRNGKGYQFFGCIHEHAEAELDKPIHPSLEIPESSLAHFGYVHEDQRRKKCIDRNFAMLKLDQQFFPGRQLTNVLWARDHINFAMWERSGNGNRMTPEAVDQCWQTVKKYKDGPWFNDPEHIYFKLIFGFYQTALQWLQAGFEFDMQREERASLSAFNESGQKMRFLSLEEFSEYSKKLIDRKVDEMTYDYPHLPRAIIPE